MRALLFDPKIFNYIIIVLYIGALARWSWYRSWGDVWYWVGALVIVLAQTFGFKRH